MSQQNSTKYSKFYVLPSYISSEGEFVNRDSELLECLSNHLESSKAFLRSNRAWKVAEICRRILFGDDKGLTQNSRIAINKLRRQGRELIGNAANIRPNFEIRSGKLDETVEDKVSTYEDLKNFWWYDQAIDRVFKEGAQEASAGLGYIFLWPEKDPNTGRWEVTAKAKSYKECFPYQIPSDNDIDKCYSFTVWCEMPFAEFCEKFPQAMNSTSPDRTAPSYIGKKFEKAVNVWRGLRDALNRGTSSKTEGITEPSFPTKDVFYTFSRDTSINETDKDILMGTLGTTGDLAGHDSYRVKPSERLFPYRRLTIWTKDLILLDGPPKWITRKVPVADLRFERLPKEFIGIPILNDGRSLEEAINRMINSISDRFHAMANFPIGVDESLPKNIKALLEQKGLKGLIGKALVMTFRTAQNPIRALFDKDLFQVDNKEFEIIKSLMELQDYVVSTNDFSNLQRKNQVPGADTVEAFVQSLGVISVDQERELSLGIQRMGQIWLELAPQIYTLKRRIVVSGESAVDLKDIDYDPDNLVPSLDPIAKGIPYWQRLFDHLERFNLIARPGSMQERQSMTKKLTLLQVQKSGSAAVTDKMIYDAFIGDGLYELHRQQYEDEQVWKAKLAANIRKEVEAIAGAGNSPEGGNLMQQLLSQFNQSTQGEGRPQSLDAAPRLGIKEDGDGNKRAVTETYSTN